MNIWQVIVNDPIAWCSLFGIALMVAMFGYYAWYFVSHVIEAEEKIKE
ncbi:DUF3149 domain-containing protein [Algibacillus agarilyticus]|nr:DUF3149 domain-containing protein [Algibacillus agarilyticus]